MGILLTSRKFLYENKNDSTFSTSTGDFTTILKGNVGDRVKVLSTIQVTVNAITTPNDSDQYESITVGSDGHISRLSGSFIDDGFLIGDVIDFTDEATSTIHIADANVLSVTDLLLVVDVSGVFGPFINSSVRVKQDLTELNFQYTTNDSNTVIETDELTESTQQYKNNGVGIDSGGGRVTTFSTSIPRLPHRWLTQATDGFKIKFVQVVNTYIQEFEYEHIFTITKYFKQAQQSNVNDLISPEPFKNGTLSYDPLFKIGSVENGGSLRTFELPKVGVDSVGWLEESFDGGENNYSLTSVSYERVSDNVAVDKLEITKVIEVTAVITATNTTFLTTDPVTIFHSYLPTKDIYTKGLNTDTYNDLWLHENKRTTIDAGTSDGTIVKNVVVTLDSSTQITAVFTIEYSNAQQDELEANFNYLLGVIVEDSTLTNSTSNRVTLKIDSNTYTKDPDTAGLLIFDKMEFYEHIDMFNDVSVGKTNITQANEDGFMMDARFHIVTRPEQVNISQLHAIIIAQNTVTGEEFEIQRTLIPIDTKAFTSSGGFIIQQLDLDSTRGFLLNDGDQFNFIKIETDNFSSPDQFYNLQVGLKIDWQSWEQLKDANTIFFDNTEPQNGLNNLTSRYSGSNDYVIKVGLLANVSLEDEEDTLYRHLTDTSTVNDYAASTYTDTTIVQIDVNSEDLGTSIIQNEDVTIKTTFDDTTVKTTVNDFEAITRLQIFEQGTETSIHEISSLKGVISGDILKPLTGETLLKKTIVSDNFTTECLLDGNKLTSSKYTLSSRIYEVIPFLNTKAVRLDGVNEVLNGGNVLGFDADEEVTYGGWFKMDVSTGNGRFFRKNGAGVTPGEQISHVATNEIIWSLTDGSGNDNQIRFGFFPNSTYHHYIFTRNGDTALTSNEADPLNDPGIIPQMKVFIDGVERLAKITNNGLTNQSILNSEPFLIGQSLETDVDEPAVWNKFFSLAEALEDFHNNCPLDRLSSSTEPNLVSTWRNGDLDDVFSNIKDRKGSNDLAVDTGDASNIITFTHC